MKTFLSSLLGIVVVVLLAICVVGWVFWSRIPDIAANHLSKKLHVSVNIDDFQIGWNGIGIEQIEVGNPPRALLSKAFSCQMLRILAPLIRYFDQHIVIEEVNLDQVYLGLEFDSPTSTKGNWTEIMSHLKTESATSREKKKGEQKKVEPRTQRSVLIHKLILTNIQVDVAYRKGGTKVQRLAPIDRIELTEISSEGGLPIDQLMNSVLGQMLKSIFEKENLKNMLEGLFQPQGGLQKYLQPFKGLFNAAPQEKEEELPLFANQI